MTDFQEIKHKSVTGVLALTTRTAFLQIISVIGNFFLTIFLAPEEFGVYFLVSAIVVFLNYFSDVGLAAALVQKHEVTREDIASTFTIQQIFVVGFSALALLFSDAIVSFYNLSADGKFLYQALIIAFILSSLKTIPSILLERKLDFQKLVIPQLFEVIAFYGIAVYLAYIGWGVGSFSLAVIARGIIGTVIIYYIQPWMPQFHINKDSLKKLLSFGIPFQLNSFLALVKDDLFTLYLGRVLPLAYVGYIGWAKKWSELPLRLIMDSIVRVTFPTYSRLQGSPEKLTTAINKTIFFIMLFIIPISIGMIATIEPFIDLIPKYEKWNPALLSFYLFVLSSAVAAISTPLVNALNALGKIKVTLQLMVIWTVLTWGITPLFIRSYGFNGFAIASLVISATVFLVVWLSKKYIRFSLVAQLVPSVVCGLIMSIFLYGARFIFPQNLLILIIVGVTSYSLSYILLFKDKIQEEFATILNVLRVQK